ncbi:cytochrome C [Sinorhizobium medicae]|nr:cytochrome C [Sinorhizobium medicae]MDX1095902.1 cytochrome C [Sinorhizobium medicae]
MRPEQRLRPCPSGDAGRAAGIRLSTMTKQASICRRLFAVVACGFAVGSWETLQETSAADKFYRVIDGKADGPTYNGYRRYHASCSHCHGPHGVGSTFASSLIDRPRDIEEFRRVVRNGQSSSGTSVMKGFADDPNFALYIDDIYAYLQARAEGALGRGRPKRLEP